MSRRNKPDITLWESAWLLSSIFPFSQTSAHSDWSQSLWLSESLQRFGLKLFLPGITSCASSAPSMDTAMRSNGAVRNEEETHRSAKQRFSGTKASSRISAVGKHCWNWDQQLSVMEKPFSPPQLVSEGPAKLCAWEKHLDFNGFYLWIYFLLFWRFF